MVDIGPVTGDGLRITPTDVAQFIRLDQCARYLRLRLYQRNRNGNFMRDYGVVPQSIPPLLTRSGAEFEEEVETGARARFPVERFHHPVGATQREQDNARMIEVVRALGAGDTCLLFQPRLAAGLQEWLLRGDIDILRLHRDHQGALHVLIADMKSSTSAKVEHRLQVAFYHEMVAAILDSAGEAYSSIQTAILYRGPAEEAEPNDPDMALLAEQRRLTQELIGSDVGFLELVEDGDAYRAAVAELVTGPRSKGREVAEAEFASVPFVLNYKCDGCMFNEFCMRWTAEHDDLSALPYVTAEDKTALHRNGIQEVRDLAALKTISGDTLTTAPGREQQVRSLSTTWPVGPRLDELIVRARRYRRWKGDDTPSPSYIPSKGYGSLPYSDREQNPNLVRVYIDAQHDYLHDRVYMLGSLVVASENGTENRRRSVVHLADGPPETPEAEQGLFVRWVQDTLAAIAELAASDIQGERRAPIHLIFWNRFEQRTLLEGLARHSERILGATPLFDFITQLAGFDSAIATFLDEEIRELRNYPMVCQSLQAVAAYLRFDWNRDVPYRDLFRTRMFDFWGKFEWEEPKEVPWYISRARFNSQIPLEYAYAAWGELPDPTPETHDDFSSYRGSSPDLLSGFHARRLDAMEHIAHDFRGNKQTAKSAYVLPDLDTFEQTAPTLAHALEEFIAIERQVDLSEWKTSHLAPPERRVLSGLTLIGQFREADQELETLERNRENTRRDALKRRYKTDAGDGKLTKEQSKDSRWNAEGMRFRLRLDAVACDCDLDEMLRLSTLRTGDVVIVMPRQDVDSRLPPSQQTPFTPTPKQLLYGMRAKIIGMEVARDATGRPTSARVDLEMQGSRGGSYSAGYAFGSMERPLVSGEMYTLDQDINSWYDYFCLQVVQGLTKGGASVLYERLRQPERSTVQWPESAEAAQRRFLAGLEALQRAGVMHEFEPGKERYIGAHGRDAILMVQGPPGTGKSYSTAFAVFARIQGAMAAGADFRVFVSCKTHAATDVLLRNIADVQATLRGLRESHPALWDQYFDPRLLDIPLFRFGGKGESITDVTYLHRKQDRQPGEMDAVNEILAHRWCVVGTAPAGTYRMLKDRYDALFGHALCDCLVLDEASQMGLPEALMAALPLTEQGQLIVVGDHRQMAPIVKHNWNEEMRRTFRRFRAYDSLFTWLLGMDVPIIRFEESFRLHADMAEFLRREVYVHDGIAFHSQQHRRLKPVALSDPFVAAVLDPAYAIVVVMHDEVGSMMRNDFERALITPVLDALAVEFAFDPEDGMGVVVPHRAQRAALQEAVPHLTVIDPMTGATVRSAVDTVERFQGDERDAIVVSTTESDPQYLLVSGDFLLDPCRLTVALSRAKRKMVLVASRSVFTLFSTDEQTFQNAQIWKNLLRHTCTALLWSGERQGHRVEVWGNEVSLIGEPGSPDEHFT